MFLTEVDLDKNRVDEFVILGGADISEQVRGADGVSWG